MTKLNAHNEVVREWFESLEKEIQQRYIKVVMKKERSRANNAEYVCFDIPLPLLIDYDREMSNDAVKRFKKVAKKEKDAGIPSFVALWYEGLGSIGCAQV